MSSQFDCTPLIGFIYSKMECQHINHWFAISGHPTNNVYHTEQVLDIIKSHNVLASIGQIRQDIFNKILSILNEPTTERIDADDKRAFSMSAGLAVGFGCCALKPAVRNTRKKENDRDRRGYDPTLLNIHSTPPVARQCYPFTSVSGARSLRSCR